MKRFTVLLTIICLAMAVTSCKDPIDTTVSVTTAAVTEITETSALSGGEVTTDGGSPISAYGICWSTKTTPTISDAKTKDGSGLGTFISSISALTPGVTYYVRAYASNANGTTYGDAVSFTTISAIPTLTTSPMSDVTYETAVSGGVVNSNGGSAVTSRGVCWGTAENPDITGSKTEDALDGDTFVSNMTGLKPDVQYYVRAYATNAVGTGYGNQITFSSSSEPVIEISDNAFLTYLKTNIDLNNDSKIQVSEANSVTAIDCSGLGIASLEGIANFKNLSELRCQANNLSSIDASSNPELTVLWAFDNPELSEVNVKGLAKLQFLHIYNTRVGSINLGDCVSLTEFVAYSTQIESVDLTYNTQLATVGLQMSLISSIDLSNKTSLRLVLLNDSPLSSVNVSGCTALEELFVQGTSLKSLDAGGLSSLKTLWAFDWKTEDGTINASDCSSLQYLHAYNSKLSSINVKGCSSLIEFRCFASKVTSMDFSDCKSLTEINLDGAPLEKLVVNATSNPVLSYINIHQNKLSSIDLSNMPSLKYLHCGLSAVSSLTLKGCDALEEAYIFNDNLTFVDFSNLPKLRIVWGYQNPLLTSINFDNCSALYYIDFNSCAITGDIKFDNMPDLWRTIFWNNQINKATYSNDPALDHFNFENNTALTEVNVSNCNALANPIFVNTSLVKLDLTGCLNLWQLAVRNVPTLQTLTLGNNPALTELYAWDTKMTTLDLTHCADAMKVVYIDANPSLTTLYMRSVQTIADLHKDAGCTIVAK